MWNTASSSATPGSGGASAPSGAAGGSHSNAVHTPGAFAQHARPANLVNSPSAHRRMGGIGPVQHASPSHTQTFLRPVSNVAFPGTVSTPRSAAPPNSASTPQKSVRHLPLLTTRTPASLAKLAFPPGSSVFWYCFESKVARPAQDASTEPLGRDPAAIATTSVAGSLEEVHAAWEAVVWDVVTRINKSRSRSQGQSNNTDNALKHDHAALDPLLQDPLVHTSLARLDRSDNEPSGSRPWSHRFSANLWLFVVATVNVESASNAPSTGAGILNAQPGHKDRAGSEPPSKDTAQPAPSSYLFNPIVARQLSPGLVKALTRLTTIAKVESGSYSLASAAEPSADSKGKQSFLTSEQRKVNKLFIASVKARIVDSILEPPSAPHSQEKQQGEGDRHAHPPHASRPRLRLGDNVVFLPSQSVGSHAHSGSDPGSLAGRETTFAFGGDQRSIVTEIGLSVCKSSLLIRSASRRFAALPLASTWHASTRIATLTPSAPAPVLLAPLGYHTNLLGVVPNNSIADEHLVDLRSLFASLAVGQKDAQYNDTLFASGMAICELFPSELGKRSSIGQLHSPFRRQQTASHDACVYGGIREEDAGISALSTIDSNGQAQSQVQEQEHKQERRHFFWPVAWCLVVQDRTDASACPSDSALFSHKGLQCMRSQPTTPLKELVSFTLKVLNDANENTFEQNTASHTPSEAVDATLLARNRVDGLPSNRTKITPGSISFPDFDFAISAAGSATSAPSHHTAAHSVVGVSPTKRDATSADFAPGSNNTEAFGEDLNWMRFLPQASEGEASASAATAAPTSAMQTDDVGLPAAGSGTGPSPSSLTTGRRDSKDVPANPPGSSWTFPSDAATAPSDPGAVAAKASSQSAPQTLLQPHGRMLSQGSTPIPAHDNTTPLGFAQPSQPKRKAGENDIFGNLGLLTEDDFSFFDGSTFGLEPENTMPGTAPLMPPQLDHATEADRPSTASSHDPNFAQPIAIASHPGSSNMSAHAVSGPVTSTVPSVDDVTMRDLEQNSLDALFNAIPGLQDVMMTSETSQAREAPPLTIPTSATITQVTQSGHEAPAVALSSAHPFHSATSSFTPRDASGTTPFGDPASLPGFTPSSLTESSPAFGNPSHKTPRTPYSPVEEYRDGAMIVDLQHPDRMRESAQSYRESNTASASDRNGHPHSLLGHKQDVHLEEEPLHLADASTAAAAAAKAAMETDTSSRKRPTIVPDAFLPLAQPQARKPLQRLTTSARANLGRKYDFLGKFASKPKTTATILATTNPAKAPSTEKHLSKAARQSGNPAAGIVACEPGRMRQVPLSSELGLAAVQHSPSKTPSRRGQALLQLRRDRRHKTPPGITLSTSRAQRMLDGPATPRSSDDIAVPEAFSASDSETSSFGDEDSEEALSDREGAMVTFSSEDQASLKSLSRDIVAWYLGGAFHTSAIAESTKTEEMADQIGEDVAMQTASAVPSLPFRRSLHSFSVLASTGSVASFPRPTIRRWMLTRTAEWIIQNPQFRAMYRPPSLSLAWSDIAIGEKIEVLEALASALRISPPSHVSSNGIETQATLPTLKSLVRPSRIPATGRASDVEPVEVLEPTQIAVGCQGSVVEALPSALTLWEKSKLSAVSGEKHVVAKVLLTYASPAWHDEVVAWLDRLRVVFETHGLGTHVGGVQSILAVADGSEPLSLSSYLDRLWKDGETWFDTLRSIASRVQLDLLQGKHVVVYTLQPPTFATRSETGFHGLLRLEADLRAMLSEQVGVLAEQLLVRPVSPSMVTESGSLGFSQQAHSLRRLAFSVYDQLPRLVRRQPAKVLHGKEPGPISAFVQFPAFSLTSRADGKVGRTNFSLSWLEEPGAALDEHMLLHVAYRICCHSQLPSAQGSDGRASLDPSATFGSSNMPGDCTTPHPQEKLVMVSAMDERGGSSTVNVLDADNGDSSIEACIERIWRFALAQASRARVRWRLAISSAGLISEREQRSWQRVIGAYLGATDAKERVMGSVVLLSVRPDESGAIVAERGGKTMPNQEWTLGAEKASSVLLDAADLSQVLRFEEPVPLGWTQAFGAQVDAKEDEEEGLAMPVSSAILVHWPRQDLLGSGDGFGLSSEAGCSASHVLAVDLLQCWTQQTQGRPAELEKETVKEEDAVMDAILRSLHQLRLVSEERHQLPFPFNAQPWPIASVNTLTTYLGEVVLGD